MFGSVQIVTDQVENKVACPTTALVTAGAETFVFVQQKKPSKEKPGQYEKRNVVLGLRMPHWVEVTDGLFPGDEVVVKGKVFDALPVRSPIDGYVVRFDVIPGQVVKAENPLFEIHDMSKVWVRGFVFEKDLAKVRLEQPVRIRLASDPAFLATAKLVRTNYVLSSTERVLSVWAELDNPERKLKDNMLASMTISAGVNRPVTAVPIGAVLNEGSQTYVFVKKPDKPDKADYFDRRPVEVGRRDDRFVEIKNGVKPGELVAIGGVQELRTAYASVR
ncbi:MAG: efflux RND transporter periplasmic adaptor subunit [Planctomycetes bacterium]|nr:efflux RND transporter periplasmic adaptor subunit [Planctomycetota bacterium]